MRECSKITVLIVDPLVIAATLACRTVVRAMCKR
jgi:hypothetical protein